jgi:hypothetical protein
MAGGTTLAAHDYDRVKAIQGRKKRRCATKCDILRAHDVDPEVDAAGREARATRGVSLL